MSDDNTRNFKQLSKNIGLEQNDSVPWDHFANCVYNSKTKQLMLFQETCDYFLVCDIYDGDQDTYHWRKSEIKLKSKPSLAFWCDVILGWNQILFIFDRHRSCIECIDLLHPDKGTFIDNEYAVDIIDGVEFVAKDENNNAHLLRLSDDKPFHFRIDLYELIPKDILEINVKDYNPLVVGYCKMCQKNDKIPFIPLYLKKLILQFYPLFV